MDFLHTSEDGKETWTRMSVAPFRPEKGQITGAVVVVQDIDQEKRAQQANLLLIAELQHRTRNLLAVVHALSAETLASSHSLDDDAARRSRLPADERAASTRQRAGCASIRYSQATVAAASAVISATS